MVSSLGELVVLPKPRLEDNSTDLFTFNAQSPDNHFNVKMKGM